MNVSTLLDPLFTAQIKFILLNATSTLIFQTSRLDSLSKIYKSNAPICSIINFINSSVSSHFVNFSLCNILSFENKIIIKKKPYISCISRSSQLFFFLMITYAKKTQGQLSFFILAEIYMKYLKALIFKNNISNHIVFEYRQVDDIFPL